MKEKLDKVFIILREEGFISVCKPLLRYFENLSIFLLFRIYFRAYIFLRRKNLILKKIQGNKMFLNLYDKGISTELFIKGSHESVASAIFKKKLEKGMVVVDIGGNIGYFALIEARIVSERGKVYAIEPVQYNFELLNKNIEINDFDNIVDTFQVAISDKDGYSNIYLSKYSNCCSLVKLSQEARCMSIETLSLDSFLRDKESIDFIRMDVEGFEYEIINGMTKILQKGKSLRLFIEFHPDILKIRGLSIESLLRRLENFGFKITTVVTKDTERIIWNPSTENVLGNPVLNSYPFLAFFER